MGTLIDSGLFLYGDGTICRVEEMLCDGGLYSHLLQGPTVIQKEIHLEWNLNLGFCDNHPRLVFGSCAII